MTPRRKHLPSKRNPGLRTAIIVTFGAVHLWRAVWAGALLAVSALYFLPEAAPPGDGNVDKIMHLAAFSTIGFPLHFATRSVHTFRRLTALTLIYAPLLELGHLLAPARSFSFFDMVANITGIAIGIVIATALACALGMNISSAVSSLWGTSRGSATPLN